MNKRLKNQLLLVFIFMVTMYVASFYQPEADKSSDSEITRLYQNKASDVQIEITGTVLKLLPDDNKGSRHQRFILDTKDNITLLIAHNIDLAPRINSLKIGDMVTVYGEYEWNEKGGVIHWTHHDPQNRHSHGWIRHQGQLYQ